MATKYTILETEHTEESTPYSSKKTAVADADKLAAQYPGTTFAVCTAAGKIVHRSLSVEEPAADEAVDPDPVDEVPETQVDEDFEPETEDGRTPDVDEDFEPESDEDADGTDDPFNTTLNEVLSEDQEPAQDGDEPDREEGDEEEGDADQGDSEDAQQDDGGEGDGEGTGDAEQTGPAKAPELELCAANTNAKRMHYRPIGSMVSECGSAATTRRANQHQIDTASMCTACTKLRGDRVVDETPAGTGRGTGSRKSPKRLVMDASEVRELVAHLKQGAAYVMELTDGTRVEVVAGDPSTDEADDDKADMQSIRIVEG